MSEVAREIYILTRVGFGKFSKGVNFSRKFTKTSTYINSYARRTLLNNIRQAEITIRKLSSEIFQCPRYHVFRFDQYITNVNTIEQSQTTLCFFEVILWGVDKLNIDRKLVLMKSRHFWTLYFLVKHYT